LKLNRLIAGALTYLLFFCLLLFFPLLPLLAALVFWRIGFISEYPQTLKNIWRHMQAMREGPAIHYFSDVMGRVSQVPQAMGGSCVQLLHEQALHVFAAD
jgi:hypothetical protein